MMESTCTKCIRPNVDLDLINRYDLDTPPFFDVDNKSKNYYCISEAKEK